MLYLPCNDMEQGRNKLGLNTEQVYICTVITEKKYCTNYNLIALVLI